MANPWVEYIKSNVSMKDVLRFYNVGMNQPSADITQFACPLHGDSQDGTPSARLYETDTAYCWGCDKYYDTISFVQTYEGKNFHDTLRFIERTFKLTPFQIKNEKEKKEKFIVNLEKEVKIDPQSHLSSLEKILVRNKKYCTFEEYVKFCYALDVLNQMYSKKLKVDDEIILMSRKLKEKILLRVHDDSNY
jgi:DNA primase